jgi:hypothetical protein
MNLRNQQTGAVVTDSEFRAAFPNTGFPIHITEQTYNEFGYDVVLEGPQASGGTVYQYSVYGGVEQIDGKWYTKYILGPSFFDTEDAEGHVTTAAENEANYKASKDAEQAKNVRTQRTEKLRDSDWTQVADAPIDKAAWAAYRQALRDVPTQSGFPWQVTWPTQPE